MALTESYLVTTKNLQSVLNSIISAKSPDRFTNKFLEDLGFKSSNDRLYSTVFKALGLLDENSVPTQRYHQFLDQSESWRILAVGVQEAYADLFALRKDAQNLSLDEIKGKLKTLTQGQKSDNVISWMANTFKALCELSDWQAVKPRQNKVPVLSETQNPSEETLLAENGSSNKQLEKEMNLHYNLQIHLPETTNMAVYDAIFQSLKKHLY